MTTELILIFIIAVLLFLLLKNFLFSNLHITKEVIDCEYDVVWKCFSEPKYYADLFPNWIENISRKSEKIYQAKQKYVKESVEISIENTKKYGYIKLIIGNKETSQIRIVPLDKNRTLTLNIGYRWEGFIYPYWLSFKIRTDKDYKNAKRIIEKQSQSNESKA